MADAEVSFALNLEGNLDKSGKDDAAALEELKQSITQSTASLREMQRAYSMLKGSATANVGTLKTLKDQITAQKAALANSTERLVGMRGAFDKIPKPADATRGALSRMVNGASGARGPLGGLLDKLSGVRGLLVSGGMAGGAGALAAAFAAAGIAATAAAVGVAHFVLASTGARRAELLQLEGLSKYRNYWLEMVTGQRRVADSASFMQGAIDSVAASTPILRSRIAEMNSELSRAGLRGANLKAALEGLAIVESAQGQEAAAAFKARVLGAQLYGTSVKKLSADVKANLGGIVKAQMLDLSVQQRKLRENLSMLFADVQVEPLLRQFANLVELFSQSSSTGRALKSIVDPLLSPLIGALFTAGPLMKRFFQGFVIGALLVGITVLKVRNVLRDTFGGSELLKGMDLQRMALSAGTAAFVSLATVVGVVAVAFGIFAAGVYAAYATVKTMIDWAKMMIAPFRTAASFVMGLDWVGLGTSVVTGIAEGIKSGATAVINAMTSLGDSTMRAFKKKLGIASPSRVAFSAALEVPRGQRLALEAGRSMVKTSAERLGAATEAGLRTGMRSGGAAPQQRAPMPRIDAQPAVGSPIGQKAPITFSFGDLHVHSAASPGQGEQVKQNLRELIEEIFERVSVNLAAA